jgi:hypothetical protein
MRERARVRVRAQAVHTTLTSIFSLQRRARKLLETALMSIMAKRLSDWG